MPPLIIYLQRIHCADSAAGALGQNAFRAAAQRYRAEFSAYPTGHGSGRRVPYPYGGKQRQVMVDLNPALLQAKGLRRPMSSTPSAQQNLILPSGTAKIGQFEYDVDMNGSPRTVEQLNDLPIKTVGNTTIYMRDVAHVRDGFAPQTNIVRLDGQRGALLTILKAGNAPRSTWSPASKDCCRASQPRFRRNSGFSRWRINRSLCAPPSAA